MPDQQSTMFNSCMLESSCYIELCMIIVYLFVLKYNFLLVKFLTALQYYTQCVIKIYCRFFSMGQFLNLDRPDLGNQHANMIKSQLFGCNASWLCCTTYSRPKIRSGRYRPKNVCYLGKDQQVIYSCAIRIFTIFNFFLICYYVSVQRQSYFPIFSILTSPAKFQKIIFRSQKVK